LDAGTPERNVGEVRTSPTEKDLPHATRHPGRDRRRHPAGRRRLRQRREGQDDATAPSRTAATAAPSTSAAPDYSASTEAVCDKLQTLYTVELRAFGTAMGKMVTYKEAKQTADAEKGEATAAGQLKAAATKIRTATAAAEDPDFQAAGKVSASKLESSATDRRYMDKVKPWPTSTRRSRPSSPSGWTPVAGLLCG
jgi:hypothetical protein